MSQQDRTIPPDDDGKFAQAVVKLYRHATTIKSEPFKGNIAQDVRRAAYGLALLRDLLDHHAKSMTASRDIPSSGIREAYAILDHLTTGRDHPIKRHINGLRTAKFRANKAPVNSIELFCQAIVVAVARAYREVAGVRQAEAIRKTVECAARARVEFSEEQVRGWDKKFTTSENRLPDYWASRLVTTGDPEKVLALGATWIWKHWTVPSPPD